MTGVSFGEQGYRDLTGKAGGRKNNGKQIDVSFDKRNSKAARARRAGGPAQGGEKRGRRAAGSESESGSGSDDSEEYSNRISDRGEDEYGEEEEFQREVDEIINSVMNLDLGDARSNHAMH